MPKVLLISSYKVSCGIATFTEALETLIEKDFDVEVQALDQAILKSTIPHVVAAGDRLVRELCARMKDYDVVNLQWEPGLLGDRQDLMSKRLEWILDAAEKLILTVHTVVPYPTPRGLLDFAHFLRKRGLKRGHQYFLDPEPRYRRETYRILHKRAQSEKKTTVVVHTERERQFFHNVVGFRDVFDHPLSLIHADWPERIERDGARARRELEELFPGKRTFIGVFGFISAYKGLETAIRAMPLLDDGCQLLIYGGVHPGVLREREPVNSYVKHLMAEIEADLAASKMARTLAKGESAVEVLEVQAQADEDEAGSPGEKLEAARRRDHDRSAAPAAPLSRNTVTGGEQNLFEKVAFLGAPDDYEFALAMDAVDICLFPYLEVGQSGSGPASMAIQIGKKTILSRTKAFIELARYYPKHFEMIDVGNHLQLAQTIQRMMRRNAALPPLTYTNETLAAFYGKLIRELAPEAGSTRRPVEAGADQPPAMAAQ